VITATPYLDLSSDNRASDRRALRAMCGVRPGSRVLVFVGRRSLYDVETARHLSEYVLTHHLEFMGDVAATDAWSKAVAGSGW